MRLWWAFQVARVARRPFACSPIGPNAARCQSACGHPVYVWGRYQDWYRVETKDHILAGFTKYIDARHLRKVRDISTSKPNKRRTKARAKRYSARPPNSKFTTRYGGKGAVKVWLLRNLSARKTTSDADSLSQNVHHQTSGNGPKVRRACGVGSATNPRRLAPLAPPARFQVEPCCRLRHPKS
jgi:hypothetical protein